MAKSKIADLIEVVELDGSKQQMTIAEAVVRAVGLGASLEDAAEGAGVHRDTVYGWQARGQEHASDSKAIPANEQPFVRFSDDLTRARAQGISVNLQVVRDAAVIDRDWRAAKWYLSIMRPERYSERHKIEHSGKIGVNTVDLTALSDEEAEQLEGLLAKVQADEGN